MAEARAMGFLTAKHGDRPLRIFSGNKTFAPKNPLKDQQEKSTWESFRNAVVKAKAQPCNLAVQKTMKISGQNAKAQVT
jgi:hypothetical protein